MKYVDLFAGCGGLSLGIELAGGELVLAVEKSDMAARSFYHNLIDDAGSEASWRAYLNRDASAQIDERVLVKELGHLLAMDDQMQRLDDEMLDLVVGGPPCQGFSLAGRRQFDDARNTLPWQFLEFVGRTAPKAVVIENVVGMDHSFEKHVPSSFLQLQEALRRTGAGYVVQGVRVNAMHYGAPQHRPRLMIIGLRADEATALGVESTERTWQSQFIDELETELPALAPAPTVARKDRRVLADALGDLRDPNLAELSNSSYIRDLNGLEWPVRAKQKIGPYNHVKRNHRDRSTLRFRVYQYLANAGITPRLLHDLSSMAPYEAGIEAAERLNLAQLPALSPDGTLLASTRSELIDLVLSLATRKHSQKVLSWAEPARTVVTLPDDYVHPLEARILTVREMARLQGFPDQYEFLGKETTGSSRRKVEVPQYSQVGNAVSPWLALAVGKRLKSVLSRNPVTLLSGTLVAESVA